MKEPASKDNQSTWLRHLPGVLARLRTWPWVPIVEGVVGLVLALALRYTLLDFKSVDYYASLKPWYLTLRAQGFSAFATDFSTYNPPYLYLLYLVARFLPDVSIVVGVKLPAIAADVVCAVFTFLLVRLKYANRPAVPLLAAGAIMFAPTVVLNSSFWGQADSLLALGILGAVYFLALDRPGWAMLFYGIALAFKLQGAFLAPVIVALALRRIVPWKTLLIIPAVLLVALLPAWIAGRPFIDLLGIYAYQASQFEYITMNAFSAYTWLPGSKQVFNLFLVPAVLMGAAAALALCYVIYRSGRKMTVALIIEVSLLAMIVVPFFLPKMHDRYFYPADVLSIVFAFFNPGLFWVPFLIVGSSFVAYQPFLFERDLVPLPVLTLVILILVVLLGRDALSRLFPSPLEAEASEPGAVSGLANEDVDDTGLLP
jgi:Gpi18-like mannosyltransferase